MWRRGQTWPLMGSQAHLILYLCGADGCPKTVDVLQQSHPDGSIRRGEQLHERRQHLQKQWRSRA